MTERERFNAVMHYRERDRSPICDFGFWWETIELWHTQGLPEWVTGGRTDEFFGMDAYSGGPWTNVGLCPGFEGKVLEDRGDHEVAQQQDGVRVLRKKHMGSIPVHLGHLLVDRQSWQEHYKPKLNPDDPRRLPQGEAWGQAVALWRDESRLTPATVNGGSLYGLLRDWMGMENLAMVVYDDPAWFEEMVTTMADVAVATITKALATGAKFDGCSMWEDMCYRGGPLLSPQHFKQYLVPHYKRITGLLRSHGVDVVWLDCDGKIDDLLPLWLDAGVNCMFPVEIGTWGADPVKYRKQYGKQLLMLGGFDKHILAQGKREILAEIKRLTPLVEEGGFIPFCDHRVPPDVSLENYVYYLKTARQIWGKDLPNLKPMGC